MGVFEAYSDSVTAGSESSMKRRFCQEWMRAINPGDCFLRKYGNSTGSHNVNISKSLLPGMVIPAWFDLVLFKLSWIALVVYQADALVPVLCIIAFKILSWRDISTYLPIILLIFVSGLLMDSVLTVVDVFVFPTVFLPSWLILLWLSFAMTLPRGFLFISRWNPFAQAAIGAVAGCAGYLAGYLLNAVTFSFPLLITMALIALLWAGFVPLMYMLNDVFSKRRLDQ